MRILVVIPHYFGPSHPENNLPAIGSYIEPLGRIAALNDLVVGLHRHFGPDRYDLTGLPIAEAGEAPRAIDIVVLAIRGNELTGELGFAPGTFEVEYVDCKPPWIAFEAQRVLRERLGRYDFYCFMEDDLVIHDPAFFDKLIWFQQSFGPKTLLMPVRYEVAGTGNPAKIIIDPELDERWYRPFRRPGQRERLEATWNGRSQTFRLPSNPHAGAFFLSAEQMEHWVKQPSYDDRDDSWTGPLESAGTLSVGKVFDLYKPVQPDPFFLELHHSGVRYASQVPRDGRRYGEPPLLAIAQNAIRAALGGDDARAALKAGGADGSSFSRLVRLWLAQGTAVKLRGQMDALQAELAQQTHALELRGLETEAQARRADDLQQRHDRLANELAAETSRARDAEQRHDRLASQLAAETGRARDAEQRNVHLAAQIRVLEDTGQATQRRNEALMAKMLELDQELRHERHRQLVHARSLRWLLGSVRAELRRRWRGTDG